MPPKRTVRLPKQTSAKASASAQPEPQLKKERVCRVLNWCKQQRCGMVLLRDEEAGYADVYAVSRDAESQNVLWFTKVQPVPNGVGVQKAYTVVMNKDRTGGSCGCKGSTNHGYCKHLSAALALDKEGRI